MKLIKKVKKVVKKVGNGVATIATVTVGVGVAAAAVEIGALGSCMAQADAEAGAKLVKHKLAPEPVYVKTSKLGRKSIKTINPVTGKVSDYNGSKKPVSKKPVIIKKNK